MADTSASEDLEIDVSCAAGSPLRVLITAPLSIARRLANRIHTLGAHQRPLVRIDCRSPEAEVAVALRSALEGAPCTLLLEDVDALSAGLKRYLSDHLCDPNVRVVATTPKGRILCRPGGFDESTFYRLNTIHIVVDDPR